MPTTEGRQSPRSSSSSSSELSNSIEELLSSSLNLTTASSSSHNTLHNLFISQQKIMAYERRKNNAIADSDEMDFYQVIHNSFLLELMGNTICIGCKEQWDGKMHITSFLGTHLAGIGRAGVAKIFGVMNLAPPVKEDHYEEIDRKLLLPCIKKFQHESMQAAIYEAVDENDDDPTALTVSGDGTWQRRGFKSIHGVAAVLSCNTTPKVLDVQRLSKKCLICTGALSMKNKDPDLYDVIINNHDCESNYDGSYGGMESQGIQEIFKRFFLKYQAQCTRYIGDGDSSVMWNLTQQSSVSRNDDKVQVLLRKICSNYSLNIYVYFKTGTKYDQQKHSLPKYVMEAIKPVFEDLASKETLQHVLNGSSQNANESFHSFLWSMAPKNRYCSGTIIDSM
ncbi:unnamed protein product [Rotaria sp. Silwood2]|nr:unnamed protein product [Rotaria sp. Silwood2]